MVERRTDGQREDFVVRRSGLGKRSQEQGRSKPRAIGLRAPEENKNLIIGVRMSRISIRKEFVEAARSKDKEEQTGSEKYLRKEGRNIS